MAYPVRKIGCTDQDCKIEDLKMGRWSSYPLSHRHNGDAFHKQFCYQNGRKITAPAVRKELQHANRKKNASHFEINIR
jgi:hypothetical protein